MAETASHSAKPIDLTGVTDPDVRRVLRSLCEHVEATLQRQQVEIEAIIEVLAEKHITSVGEFKLILQRVQQRTGRAERLHCALV